MRFSAPNGETQVNVGKGSDKKKSVIIIKTYILSSTQLLLLYLLNLKSKLVLDQARYLIVCNVYVCDEDDGP